MSRLENSVRGGTASAVPHDDLQVAGISQPSFQMLIENNADGILVVDESGAVLFANPAAAAIFGHPPDQLLHAALGRPVVSGETTEITVRRPGQRPAEVELRSVGITWAGRPAFLASLRDVSARRAQDERQRQSQKLEAIGRLTAGVTHDFKNLIAVIESGLRLLQKGIAHGATPENLNALIKEIFNGTNRATALTQQLLAFARRQSLTPRVIDLNQRIESLAPLLERAVGGGIAVRMTLAPELGPVIIDEDQLEIAILNLAVNAKDAMPDGGILTVETSNAPDDIEDVLNTAVSFVRLTVRDTGSGMSKEVLAQVFEPFFTTKETGNGTGLGLSQVYGFITQSEGHIRIESEPEKGTSVHLFLPRAAPELLRRHSHFRRNDETS